MNWDRIERNWRQLTGGLQDSYGIARDAAEKRITCFEARCEGDRWVQ